MKRKSMVIFLPIMIFLFLLYGCIETSESEVLGDPEVILLLNSPDGFLDPNASAVSYWKHYMIINADENDVEKLRELTEQFLIANRSSIEEAASIYTVNKEGIIYNAWFYRESEYLPRDWVPDESTLERDSIEMHKSDLIVLVEWEQDSSVFTYTISIRSKARKTYGDPVYRYTYVNDLLTEIQIYPDVGIYDAEYTYPDFDGDGISNKDEVEQGTDPYFADK